MRLFESLRVELSGRARVAEQHGLSQTGFAIYGLLAEPLRGQVAEPTTAYGTADDEPTRALASLLDEQLAPQAEIVDWQHKDDVQREMRALIKRQLRAARWPPEKLDATALAVVELLKRRRR